MDKQENKVYTSLKMLLKDKCFISTFITGVILILLCQLEIVLMVLLPNHRQLLFQLLELNLEALFLTFLISVTFSTIREIIKANKELNSIKEKAISFLGTFAIYTIFVVTFIGLANYLSPNFFVTEKDVRNQIALEQETLNKEYQPVLDYIATYKKSHKVYPKNLDNIVQKSNTFEEYEYKTSVDGKAYYLQVFPKNKPIEFYYTDDSDYNRHQFKGNGCMYHLFNDCYYKVDNNWHATSNRIFSRHNEFILGSKNIKKIYKITK